MSSVTENETALPPESAVEAAAPSVPPVIDVEELLAPIPGDNPAGEPPSVLYDELVKVRGAQESGRGSRNAKGVDWEKLLEMTTDALKSRTKDLRVCGLMIESLVRLHGLAGLRDGLKVIRGLHVSFWENLYPSIGKNGDLEGRGNFVEGLGRWAADALKEVPLTDAGGARAAYTYNHWLRKDRDTEEAKQILKGWPDATRATPLAFYERAHTTVEECWMELESLLDVMRECLGVYNKGVGSLEDTLEGVRELIQYLYQEKLSHEPPVEGDEAAVESVEEEAAGEGAPPLGESVAVTIKLRTRQEAIRQLREVAAFFRQTEPQSPVAYLVERAIRWSEMPLDAWLASVIKNVEVLGSVRETLGVDPPDKPPKE